MPRIIAVVTARAGSKGLPDKNIRELHGHPLIAWSIVAALASRSVERVICTTDGKEIAAVAQAYGAEIPFMRPHHLADDSATDIDVFTHLLGWLRPEDPENCYLVHLRPTTPFRDPSWTHDASQILATRPEITSVRSVASVDHSPYKMWKHNENEETLSPLLDVPGLHEPFNQPRQKLPAVFRHTGQIDVIRASVINSGSMTGDHIAPLFVPAESAIDIDTLNDFRFAEMLFDQQMHKELRRLAN